MIRVTLHETDTFSFTPALPRPRTRYDATANIPATSVSSTIEPTPVISKIVHRAQDSRTEVVEDRL